MSKNSVITLIGQKKEIAVSENEARQVQDALEDTEQEDNSLIKLKNFSFRRGSVRTVEINKDVGKSEIWDAEQKGFYDDEKSNYKFLASKSPKEKAKNLDLFIYLHQAIRNELPSEEVLAKAYETQISFFQSHPKRTICDAYLLLGVMPENIIEGETRHKVMLQEAYLRLAEKVIFRDMQLSGQIKSNYEPSYKETKENETVQEAKERVYKNRKADEEFSSVVSNAVNNF